jgi:hypothetical protein
MAKVHALIPATAEQLDDHFGDGDKLDPQELAALRATIERGRAAPSEECISAEEALAELDQILFRP